MSAVAMSFACSAVPTKVPLSSTVEGSSSFEKNLMSTRTNAQHDPSAFNAKKYAPRGMDMVRSVFTTGFSSVCQSVCIWL